MAWQKTTSSLTCKVNTGQTGGGMGIKDKANKEIVDLEPRHYFVSDAEMNT